jgi:hypothetical protein
MKTAKFADVVKQAGAPEVHPLWIAPAQDKTLQSAIRQHRVITVHQELRGGKKDSAEVGFREDPSAQYLVFPKSVQRFANRRIIAINYDLLAATDAAPADRGAAKSQPDRKTARPKTSTAWPTGANDPLDRGNSDEPKTHPPARPVAEEPVARPRRRTEETGSAPRTGKGSSAVVRDSAPRRRSSGGTRSREAATPVPASPAKRPAPSVLPANGKPAATAAVTGTAPSRADARLLAEVRRAMEELKAGKTVAAYERLGRAVNSSASA